MRRGRVVGGVAAGLLMLLPGGLLTGGVRAQPGSEPSPAELRPEATLEQLRERVRAYWEARVRKDYRTEYELLEPRARARTSPDEYGRGRAVEYLAAQVEGVERRGNFARVAVRLLVNVMHPLLPGGSRRPATVIEDQWVLLEGVWYRTLEADLGTPLPWPISPGFFP